MFITVEYSLPQDRLVVCLEVRFQTFFIAISDIPQIGATHAEIFFAYIAVHQAFSMINNCATTVTQYTISTICVFKNQILQVPFIAVIEGALFRLISCGE